MPTYDYECQACGHRFEKFQSMTAKLMRKCPECGKLKLQRLIGTGAGVLFKGSGFYETDYRSSSYRAGEKAASEPKKADEGGDKSGSGSETSSETSSEQKKKKSDSGSGGEKSGD